MASTIISATHQRIEEILPLVLAATWKTQREHGEKHISCNPTGYHVLFGRNNDGEFVHFDRYCKCSVGVIHGELPRAAFESDSKLADWSKSESDRRLSDESDERNSRYKRYLELKEEFGYLHQ